MFTTISKTMEEIRIESVEKFCLIMRSRPEGIFNNIARLIALAYHNAVVIITTKANLVFMGIISTVVFFFGGAASVVTYLASVLLLSTALSFVVGIVDLFSTKETAF